MKDEIRDVTAEEVCIAKESTLLAVRCSMQHWFYNAHTDSYKDANVSSKFCALCQRFNRQISRNCELPEGKCPLADPRTECCREYVAAERAYNLNDPQEFRRCSWLLYHCLSEIERKLVSKKEETYERGRLFIIDKTVCMLCETGRKQFCLIPVFGRGAGNRWDRPMVISSGRVPTKSDIDVFVGRGEGAWKALPEESYLSLINPLSSNPG